MVLNLKLRGCRRIEVVPVVGDPSGNRAYGGFDHRREEAVGVALAKSVSPHARFVVAAGFDQCLDPHRVALFAEERDREQAAMPLESLDRLRRLAARDVFTRFVEKHSLGR